MARRSCCKAGEPHDALCVQKAGRNKAGGKETLGGPGGRPGVAAEATTVGRLVVGQMGLLVGGKGRRQGCRRERHVGSQATHDT